MSVSTLHLLGVVLGSIILLIFLINSKTKLHPFLALLATAIVAAIAAGIPPADIPGVIADGAGGILGETGIVVFLGAMLGRLLADTGAVSKIADLVIDHSTPKAAPWLVAGVSFVIGIPMFFEVGMVVVMPVLYAVALRLEASTGRKRVWWVQIMVPAVAALSCLHGMLPPHPGPVIAVTGLHADMGLTILLGIVCAIPTVIVAGPLYARFIAPRVKLEPEVGLTKQYTGTSMEEATNAKYGGSSDIAEGVLEKLEPRTRSVPTWLAFVCVLVPVFLMLAHTVTELIIPDTFLDSITSFLGEPIVAMLFGVLFSYVTLAVKAGLTAVQVRESFGKGLSSIAGVVLIIAGGGAFAGVLKSSGIGDAITELAGSLNMNLLVMGWLIGVILSFCTGSATVGIVSATGILAPMAADESQVFVSLLVIAIGCGSISLNWVNHSGFWFIKEAFGMSIGQATKTHMMVQTIVSVVGLIVVLLLSLFLI